MTTMRGTGSFLIATLAGAAVFALLGSAGCLVSSSDVPENPSYHREIKPLMEAHCIRCHGAGGTLNGDPDIPDVSTIKGPPTNGDLTALADDAAGKHGLMYYVDGAPGAPFMGLYLPSMPPPPAEPLTSRESAMLLKWLSNPLP
jgi:mono/diheme cytochrome c family protein